MEYFLITYPMFTTSHNLLTLLSKKLFEADREKDKFTQKRILKVLQQWLKVRQVGLKCEFDDLPFASYTQTLLEKLDQQANLPGIKKLKNLLNNRFQPKLLLPINKEVDVSLAQVLYMGPKIIAEQLTSKSFF